MKRNIFKFAVICATLLVNPVAVNAQISEYNYATGNVTGHNHIGGLIGSSPEKEAKITNSYARGNVVGETNVGGFTGSSNGTVEKSYSTGKVTGNASTGGFAGSAIGTVADSYWDIQTSAKSQSAGGLGKNTSAMTYPHAAGTYAGWDFNNVWKADQNATLNNGYPVLTPSEVFRLDLRIVPLGAGTVSGAGFFKSGQPVPVIAEPGELYVFKGWEIDNTLVSTQLKYNLPMARNTTMIARFVSKSTAADMDIALSKSHFVLYPNPVKDLLWVDVSGLPWKVTSYSLINLMGQVINNYKPDLNMGSRTSIPVSHIKPGMYLLKLESGNEFVLEKFIKN